MQRWGVLKININFYLLICRNDQEIYCEIFHLFGVRQVKT